MLPLIARRAGFALLMMLAASLLTFALVAAAPGNVAALMAERAAGPGATAELIAKIGQLNPHLYHRDVERIVSAIFEEITTALARGDRVELRGFGAFSVKTRDARIRRHPRTR